LELVHIFKSKKDADSPGKQTALLLYLKHLKGDGRGD
jgi:hypothetical protein